MWFPEAQVLAVILDQSDPVSCRSVRSLFLLSNHIHPGLRSYDRLREVNSSLSASRALNPGPKTRGETISAQPGLLPALGVATQAWGLVRAASARARTRIQDSRHLLPCPFDLIFQHRFYCLVRKRVKLGAVGLFFPVVSMLVTQCHVVITSANYFILLN